MNFISSPDGYYMPIRAVPHQGRLIDFIAWFFAGKGCDVEIDAWGEASITADGYWVFITENGELAALKKRGTGANVLVPLADPKCFDKVLKWMRRGVG